MLKITLSLVTALLLGLPTSVFAFDEEQELEQAVRNTQEDLKDIHKRQDMLKTDDAKRAHENALTTVGSENINEIYGIASEITPYIANEAKGDPQKMIAMMEEYKKDPQGFYKKLPSDIQAKIKVLTNKVEKRSPSMSGNH